MTSNVADSSRLVRIRNDGHWRVKVHMYNTFKNLPAVRKSIHMYVGEKVKGGRVNLEYI